MATTDRRKKNCLKALQGCTRNDSHHKPSETVPEITPRLHRSLETHQDCTEPPETLLSTETIVTHKSPETTSTGFADSHPPTKLPLLATETHRKPSTNIAPEPAENRITEQENADLTNQKG